MEKPFLYKLKRECVIEQNQSYVYDSELDMLVSSNSQKTPAFKNSSLGTKKENLEKAEDQSPSLILNNI